MAGLLDGAEFSRVSSHHSNKPKACIPISTYQAHECTCCTKGRTGGPAGDIPTHSVSQLCPKNCAPSQLWQALSHLWKPPENQRALVWKGLSICQWKLILIPHKFPGNCPYLLIHLFMSFLPSLKRAGRKRARPGELWHHSSAVKTNLTFSLPGSFYYILQLEHCFIQCYFLLC